MSNIKDEWKDTGKGLGSAFKHFGKSVVKSARFVVDNADDKINDKERSETTTNAFKDGTWRETGKELGKSFGSLGKSIGHTISHPFVKNKEKKNTSED